MRRPSDACWVLGVLLDFCTPTWLRFRREAVALAAQRARVLAAAERRGGDKPALVEFDLNPRDFAYRTDGGVAVADRYLRSTRRRTGPSSCSRSGAAPDFRCT